MKIKRTLSDPLMALKMLLCEDLTLAERRVGAALIDHRNHRTGQCDPGLQRLSRELRIGRRTVIRANAGLEKKGLIRKYRHGGNFHRNGYEFNWQRFHDLHVAWERHRESVGRKQSRQNLAPSGSQTHHLGGDHEVTQTCLSNQSKETYVAAQRQQHTQRGHLPEPSKRAGEVSRSNLAKPIVNERFHVKSASSRDAAYDAAERRWNNLLMKQLSAAPDVFEPLIEKIDSDLQRATTEMELRKPGSGLPFLLSELNRRMPLAHAGGAVASDKSAVPSGDLTHAGNSDREGSAVSADFPSLNSPKQQA
jgi:hypothetical protein